MFVLYLKEYIPLTHKLSTSFWSALIKKKHLPDSTSDFRNLPL